MMAFTSPFRKKALVSVPAFLILVRFALGPLLLGLCLCHAARFWLVIVLAAAFVSDIFDGVIARWVGVATERLRVADSWADGFFYAWVCGAVCVAAPNVLQTFRVPLLLVLGLQLASYGFDLLKYRRITSFHAYSAKAWGITLFAATVALLGFHTGGVWLWLIVIFGVITNVEGFAMKIILPTWAHDVKSLRHALRLKREAERA